ncbi:hypothetical protein [Thermaerobacter litoralis]
MGGRFWAGVVVGGLMVAALECAGLRPARWLARAGRWSQQWLEVQVPRQRRRLVRWARPRARRLLARVGTR